MRRLYGWIAVGLVSGLCSTAITAAPLGTGFTYQGQIKAGGAPLDSTADFSFSLWDAAGSGNPPTGGTQIGVRQPIDALSVTAGLFTATLNAGGEFGVNAFNGSARWLQIAVRSPAGGGGFTTLAPRQPLTAAPQTLFALNADRLDNLDSTAFLQSIPVPLTLSGASGTHIIRGENTSTANGSLGVYGLSTAASGNTFGVFGQSASINGFAVYGLVSAASGVNYGGRFESASTSGRGVFGLATATSGTNYGVHGTSNSPSGFGVRGDNLAFTGGTYGGQFLNQSTSGGGVFGKATSFTGTTYGVWGETNSTSGRGVYGTADATSGTTYGVFGESDSTSGVGVKGLGQWGVFGSATDAGGYGGVFSGSGSFGSGNALWVTGDSLLTGSVQVGSSGGTPDALAKVNIRGGTDSAPGGGGYLVTGSTTSANISIDDNEIMARNAGSAATLAFNALGGNVNLIQSGTGNVGIGTSTPAVKLHVNASSDSEPGGGGILVLGATTGANVSFDANEIMARNNGATSTLFINNAGGDVVFGGAIDIGYQIVFSESSTVFGNVSCPAGKLVLGGGGVCPGGALLIDSRPYPDGTGWHCLCSFVPVTAYAICANVK